MTQILLGVAEDDADDRDKEQLALLLRDELLELPVESVEPMATAAPEGARAGLGTVAGVLVATLTPAHISAVVVTVLGWLRRGPAERTVRLEIDGDVIDVRNAEVEEQTRLIEAFLARHADRVET